MLVGGADPHRHDLSAMVMLKDNHIWACSNAASKPRRSGAGDTSTGGSDVDGGGETPDTRHAIADAVASARAATGFSLKVEVECQNEAEAEAAVLAGANVVMLDNFEPDRLKTAAWRLKRRLHADFARKDAPGLAGAAEDLGVGRRSFLIEVSGGLTAGNVGAVVCEDVDVVSTSSIHQGVPHVDFSLKVVVP